MSAKRFPVGLEVYDLGTRRLYVKTGTGFVLHSDDLTPDELELIAQDIAGRNGRLKESSETSKHPYFGPYQEFSF